MKNGADLSLSGAFKCVQADREVAGSGGSKL